MACFSPKPLIISAVLALLVPAASAALKTANTSGYWTNTATWSGGILPAAGDDVVISGGVTVTLDQTTPDLASCTNSGTLSFRGTNTALMATNVTVNGDVTHADNTDNASPWEMNNRVWIVCSNLTVSGTGDVGVDGKGYQGGTNSYQAGFGPGGGSGGYGGGGGHGAAGGLGNGGFGTDGGTYGSVSAPVHAGSGGSSWQSHDGDDGGGAVRIEASGRVTVEGTISANGMHVSNAGGGGSGGSLYITCNTFTGGGALEAYGNDGAPDHHRCGAGGGGRIAVVYNTTAQASETAPTATFRASGGKGGGSYTHAENRWARGGSGTIYLSDSSFYPRAALKGGLIVIPGFATWAVGSLAVSDGVAGFGQAVTITVTNDITASGDGGIQFTGSTVTVGGNLDLSTDAKGASFIYAGPGASLTVGGDVTVDTGWLELFGNGANPAALHVGGNLLLANSGNMYVHAGVTNGAVEYGALVSVTGDMTVVTNCHVYPYSDSTNGGSALFRVANLTVATGATFNADNKGFRGGTSTVDHGKGPGGTLSTGGGGSGGAGYGGTGGSASTAGGVTYGDPDAPIHAGSGSGYINAGGVPSGGSLVRIEADDTVTIDGTLTADGGDHNNRSGGGSGGAVYIVTETIAGSGLLRAEGGDGGTWSGGGGGGGRIAVQRKFDNWAGAASAAGGDHGSNSSSPTGMPGTVRWVQTPAPPQIAISEATNVTFTWAFLNATLTETGTATTTVMVFWDLVDQGTSSIAAWPNTNDFGEILVALPTNLTHKATGLISGTNYVYRYYASNSVGTVWTPPTNFMTRVGLPDVSNVVYGATNILLNSAFLNGYLWTTGTSPSEVSVFWGQSDGGTNLGQWDYTNDFANYQPLGPLTTNVTLPASNTFYYFRYSAKNSGGRRWTESTEILMASPMDVTATDPTATETGPTPGTFTVHRAASMTNEPITVYYSIGGSAALPTDYVLAPSGTNITLGAGVSNVAIAVNPVWDPNPESAETATLTLLDGQYVTGAMNSDTVTIQDAVLIAGSNATVISGDWNAVGTWSLGRPPITGDDVYLDHAMVLTNPTPVLASLTVNAGKTLTFNGTNNSVTASNVYVNGTVMHPENRDTAAPWVLTHRVWLICTNLTVASGGAIDVAGKGYQGGTNNSENGYGPGLGYGAGGPSGASHGGRGGAGSGQNTISSRYGSTATPGDAGSGGGAYQSHDGDDGGGVVRIDALGKVTVDGTISADGTHVSNAGGGGSGGSIYITCRTLAGNGDVRATGNDGAPDHHRCGAGGGGRVAVHYDAVAQAAEAAPAIAFRVAGGVGGTSYSHTENRYARGEPGTLYLTDASFYPGTAAYGAELVIPGFVSWSPASVALSDGVLVLPAGLQLNVAGDVTATAEGGLQVSNSAVSIGGDLDLSAGAKGSSFLYAGPSPITVGGDVIVDTGWLEMFGVGTSPIVLDVTGDLLVSNAASVYVFAGGTNGGGVGYGALIDVTESLVLHGNARVYPYAQPTNGGAPLLRMRHLVVPAGAAIDGDNKGFRGGTSTADHGKGPGGTLSIGGGGSGGAGYGGAGGGASTPGGVTYGSSNAPAFPGSGSGYVNQGGVPAGGSLIWVEAGRSVTVDGTLTANGGSHGNRSGGGSGGGIWLQCGKLAGSGVLQAKGGSNTAFAGGGGGGGRIAIHRANHVWTGTPQPGSDGTSVDGGTGPNGNGLPGTVVWTEPPHGMLMLIR